MHLSMARSDLYRGLLGRVGAGGAHELSPALDGRYVRGARAAHKDWHDMDSASRPLFAQGLRGRFACRVYRVANPLHIVVGAEFLFIIWKISAPAKSEASMDLLPTGFTTRSLSCLRCCGCLARGKTYSGVRTGTRMRLPPDSPSASPTQGVDKGASGGGPRSSWSGEV